MKSSTCGLLAVVLCLACASSMSAQSDHVLRNPQISKPAFAITPPLRDLVKNQSTELQFGFHQANPVEATKPQQLLWNAKHPVISKDPLAQNQYQPATVPTKLADWLGVGIGFFGYSVPDAPTDANLSIGDTQIVQWVNVSFAVFDLNGNNILFNGQPYVSGETLFAGLPIVHMVLCSHIRQWRWRSSHLVRE